MTFEIESTHPSASITEISYSPGSRLVIKPSVSTLESTSSLFKYMSKGASKSSPPILYEIIPSALS